MTNPPARLSKAALFSLICGLLGCVPFVAGFAALILGIPGLVNGGKPQMRGRWMAVVGMLLGIVSIAGWSFAAYWMVQGAKAGFAAFAEPGNATREYIKALGAGDEKGALAHAGVSEDELKADEAIVQAQGGYVDTISESASVNEGGSAHVEETVRFKNGTLSVKADLSQGPEGWRVTSAEILPAK